MGSQTLKENFMHCYGFLESRQIFPEKWSKFLKVDQKCTVLILASFFETHLWSWLLHLQPIFVISHERRQNLGEAGLVGSKISSLFF